MSAKTSKEVTDRQRSCRFLLTAFERQGEGISQDLAESVRPLLVEGQAEPDFLSPVHGLGLWLDTSTAELVKLDEEVYEKNAQLDLARKERDAATEELAREMSHLRMSIENQYLAPKITRLGFETPTTRIPVPLLRQAERLAESLAGEELASLLGEARYDQPFDPSTHQAVIAAKAEKLRRPLQLIDGLKRDFDRAMLAKRQAMAEHDRVFLHTARTFEAFCRLAEQSDLAERVRPSLRRPGRIENLEDGENENDGTGNETGNDAGNGETGNDQAGNGEAGNGNAGGQAAPPHANDDATPPRELAKRALVS